MPASRRARGMIFARRSWPSRRGLAIKTLIFLSGICSQEYSNRRENDSYSRFRGVRMLFQIQEEIFQQGVELVGIVHKKSFPTASKHFHFPPLHLRLLSPLRSPS